MSDFTDFYRDIIQFHNDHPINYEKKDDCVHQVEAYNPFCGDQYHICVKVDGQKFEEPSFYGHGCALSKAASSILIKYIREHSVEEFLETYDTYITMLQADLDDPFDVPFEDLMAFEGVKRNPGRLTCATLSWKALADHIRQ